MSLYNDIALNYSQIFPLDKQRVDFLMSYLDKKPIKILDIGCATGDLCFALAEKEHETTGIDLNKKMISIAINKASKLKLPVNFKVMDMNDISTLPEKNCILCFGNTLPHLSSLQNIQNFFNQVYSTLISEGYFIFQILNYDKILIELAVNFKTIETDSFLFSREYDFSNNNEILFKTSFSDKKNNTTNCDTTTLYPLKRKDCIEGLQKAGFTDISVFADYNKNPASGNEFASIYTARKT
jgi:ubiquinone/menaquinone biosynthesis C-methylase UbiE